MSRLREVLEEENKQKQKMAKIRQEKKRLLDKENAKIGQAFSDKFGVLGYEEFETWLENNDSDSVRISKDGLDFLKDSFKKMNQNSDGNWRFKEKKDFEEFMNEFAKRIGKM